MSGWAEYLDTGGEIQTEADQTGHTHSYRPTEVGGNWGRCDRCRCWTNGLCDHERNPMCARRMTIMKERDDGHW